MYRRIAALEREVGFACLLRTQGITPAGSELAALARVTRVSLDQITRRARAQRQELKGTVTLTTIDGFAPLLVAPIAALVASHPQLRIDVHISDAGLSLRRHQAEIGLSLLADPPETLVGRRLFPVHWGVFAHRAVDPDQARWLVLGAPLHTSWLGAWEKAHVPRDRIALATPSRRLLVDLVAAGVGIGLLPARLVTAYPELVELRGYRPSTAPLTRSAWLLTHADLRHDARVALVMKELAKYLLQG